MLICPQSFIFFSCTSPWVDEDDFEGKIRPLNAERHGLARNWIFLWQSPTEARPPFTCLFLKGIDWREDGAIGSSRHHKPQWSCSLYWSLVLEGCGRLGVTG